MKTKVIFIFIFFFALGTSKAQLRSTKETKVVLVVGEKSGSITHITLLNSFKKMEQSQRSKKYPNAKFYIGLLTGNYELDKENVITPSASTTITMYTEKQVFTEEHLFSGDGLSIGDDFELGQSKAKVISNKKGELTFQIKK